MCNIIWDFLHIFYTFNGLVGQDVACFTLFYKLDLHWSACPEHERLVRTVGHFAKGERISEINLACAVAYLPEITVKLQIPLSP